MSGIYICTLNLSQVFQSVRREEVRGGERRGEMGGEGSTLSPEEIREQELEQ